ncbi:MAG: PorV/PorQ family protein, partial [bacterium]
MRAGQHKKMRCGFAALIFIMGVACFFTETAEGQIRSGSAFLKMLPGARHQGMAAGVTGAIDDMHALYANPATTAFLREWQWSSNYSRWFAGIFQTSVNYGRQFRTPWSKKRSVLALGFNFQGVDGFDSSDGVRPQASANDLMLALSFGQPLNSNNFSFGTNFKYLRSRLANFSASALIFDTGLLVRTNQIAIGDYSWIFSAGVSVTHLGNSLTFISEKTPLPRTFRFGAAINVGKHHGWQFQLTSDYQKIKDETDHFSLGFELSNGYHYALRGGYNFNSNLLSKLSMGLSLRLDDRWPFGKPTAGRANAIRLDGAYLESNDLFAPPLRVGGTYYPIGPERFDLDDPVTLSKTAADTLVLSWQASRDPDLFDKVTYSLFLTHDRKLLIDLRKQAHKNSLDDLVFDENAIKQIDSITEVSHRLSAPERCGNFQYWEPGDTYWTVLAYDLDKHIRFAERIGSFHIEPLDILEITGIEFTPDSLITKNSHQGIVRVTVKNKTERTLNNVVVTTTDSKFSKPVQFVANPDEPTATPLNIIWLADSTHITPTVDWNTEALGWRQTIDEMQPGATATFEINWRIRDHGVHRFFSEARVVCKEYQFLPESNTDNNKMEKLFVTIPKGLVFTKAESVTQDSVTVFVTPRDCPGLYVPNKIFFAKNSSNIKPEYLAPSSSNAMLPHLKILAARISEQTNINLLLYGVADTVSGENINLAKSRKFKVQDLLISLGVESNRFITPINDSKGYPGAATSNSDVEEERRYVEIIARLKDGTDVTRKLFKPISLPCETLPAIELPVVFQTTPIQGKAANDSARIQLRSGKLTGFVPIGFTRNIVDAKKEWRYFAEDSSGRWLNKNVEYSIVLEDSLRRTFRTVPRKVYLREEDNGLPTVVGLAEFNNPEPFPVVPWPELLEQIKLRLKYNKNLRMTFIGHACGIPPATINNTFSRKRAYNFLQQFCYAVAARDDPELQNLLGDCRNIEAFGVGANERFTFT